MHFVLFNIGNIPVHGYGLMIGIGIIAAFIVLELRAKQLKINSNIAWIAGIIGGITGFIGGKLLYMIVEWEDTVRDPLGALLHSEGFVVYGGLITGVICTFIYVKAKKVSFFEYFDLIIPEVALAQGFGRIGCFFAGCCYGREAHMVANGGWFSQVQGLLQAE